MAQIVIEEMGLEGVKLVFTGGVDGGKRWKGDVKNTLLEISKLKTLGWKPKHNSRQAVGEAAKSLLTTP
jgi:UDP-glucose 4-epimerase